MTHQSSQLVKEYFCRSPPAKCRIVSQIFVPKHGMIPVLKGDFHVLSEKVQAFVTDKARLMTPRAIYICDGSAFEYEEMVESLEHLQYFRNPSPRVAVGQPDPIDVEDARRVRANTFFTTKFRPRTSATDSGSGVSGSCVLAVTTSTAAKQLRNSSKASFDSSNISGSNSSIAGESRNQSSSGGGGSGQAVHRRWMSTYRLRLALVNRFSAAMRGRVMFVVPLSVGAVGAYYANNAVQLTDNPHVVVHLHVVARVSYAVWDTIGNGEFVKCIHSVGLPRPVTVKLYQDRLRNVHKIFVGQWLDCGEIWSFGTSLVNVEVMKQMIAEYPEYYAKQKHAFYKQQGEIYMKKQTNK